MELAKAAMKAEHLKADLEVDIILTNLNCNFSVECHLNLEHIAMNSSGKFNKKTGMVIMSFETTNRKAFIWPSGKITMNGSSTEIEAETAAQECVQVLDKLGYNVTFTNYRVTNIFATCTMPFGIKIEDFARAHPKFASYEPELQAGVIYKMNEIKATLRIYTTGTISIAAPSVANVKSAVEKAYALIFWFKREPRKICEQNHRHQSSVLKERQEIGKLDSNSSTSNKITQEINKLDRDCDPALIFNDKENVAEKEEKTEDIPNNNNISSSSANENNNQAFEENENPEFKSPPIELDKEIYKDSYDKSVVYELIEYVPYDESPFEESKYYNYKLLEYDIGMKILLDESNGNVYLLVEIVPDLYDISDDELLFQLIS